MALPQLAEARAAGCAGARTRTSRPGAATGRAGLAVLGLTIVGLLIRVPVARESLFADELSTYWISATHGLHQVLSLIYGTAAIKHAEITPPLYFVASWLTVQLGHSPILLRLPSLVAGTLTIPVIYLLGLQTVGRARAMVATALTVVSPFMIYYSTEARAYAVMMLLVAGSTLAMLLAVDTGRRRWWVLYAVCASLAFWTHNTCLFVLGAQLLWVLWAHPHVRRPALLATLGAAVGAVPWLPGFINELRSPTLTILSDLSPFNAAAVWEVFTHWTIGYPYGGLARLTQIPGVPALVLLLVAGLVAAGAALVRYAGVRRPRPGLPSVRREDRLVLLVLLLLVTPVAEGLISAVSTHIFGLRNLAASWPELALVFASIVLAAGRRVGVAVAVMVIAALGLGAARMVSGRYERPDYQSAARFVQANARPGDVVLDETGDLSPGPLTGLDVALTRPKEIVRARAPQEREHPFTLRDPYQSVSGAITLLATGLVRPGGRIFVVGGLLRAPTLAANAPGASLPVAARYLRRQARHFVSVPVVVYSH
jgi:4-amino-4-deoxy-L-arabinose transferase-like glycosyltransferase